MRKIKLSMVALILLPCCMLFASCGKAVDGVKFSISGAGTVEVQGTGAEGVTMFITEETWFGIDGESVIYEIEVGKTVKLKLVPDAGQEVKTFTVGGVDKIGELVEGAFQFEVAKGVIAISVTFGPE